jgi:ubiquinone/menaquinone biosynthesis C-methylase UbiE
MAFRPAKCLIHHCTATTQFLIPTNVKAAMTSPQQLDQRVHDQIEYYRARASEYDDWFMRLGRYSHGAEADANWLAEVRQLAGALAAFNPQGRVLELACGTGWWTEQLAAYASSLTAVDASAEVLALNQKRLGDNANTIQYTQADLFNWKPEATYDVVFFSFWLSHVPPEKFTGFWETVSRALAPGGRVFFIDSLPSATGTASNQPVDAGNILMQRRLNDGREFSIYKVFYEPASLTTQLAALGWQVAVQQTPQYFLYGTGSRT